MQRKITVTIKAKVPGDTAQGNNSASVTAVEDYAARLADRMVAKDGCSSEARIESWPDSRGKRRFALTVEAVIPGDTGRAGDKASEKAVKQYANALCDRVVAYPYTDRKASVESWPL